MKKALIHDWYYTNGGAEKVIHSINSIWPDFDHYALFDFLNDKDRKEIFLNENTVVNTSFIQKLPTAKANHRKFLELFPLAVEQFDLREYDLIISSSSSVSKGVLTHPNQLHISYIHSPMRYAWDLYIPYINAFKVNMLLKCYAKRVLKKIRLWDVINTNRVDHIIVNSKYIAKRVNKIYRREAHVIYPPVDINNFSLETQKDDYYITASRLVKYKNVDVIVEAFSKLKDKKLLVIGDGAELKSMKLKATENVTFLGYIPKKEMVRYFQKAKAFVFAAEEDFGIVPVEAQACGTPVIAFGKGGALETVTEGVSGTFFYQQTPEAIKEAVLKFETMTFNPVEVRKNSEKFSKERFEQEFKETVTTLYTNWKSKNA